MVFWRPCHRHMVAHPSKSYRRVHCMPRRPQSKAPNAGAAVAATRGHAIARSQLPCPCAVLINAHNDVHAPFAANLRLPPNARGSEFPSSPPAVPAPRCRTIVLNQQRPVGGEGEETDGPVVPPKWLCPERQQLFLPLHTGVGQRRRARRQQPGRGLALQGKGGGMVYRL